MLKKTAETLIGGALGLIALYVVGKIAYQAGQEMGREECRFQAMQNETRRNRIKKQPAESISEPVSDADNAELSMIPVADPIPVQRKKKSKLSLLFGAGRILGNRKSVIGHLVQNPEDHRFEAYVEGNELQIHVKRREERSDD